MIEIELAQRQQLAALIEYERAELRLAGIIPDIADRADRISQAATLAAAGATTDQFNAFAKAVSMGVIGNDTFQLLGLRLQITVQPHHDWSKR